jgi:hypothetical protein
MYDGCFVIVLDVILVNTLLIKWHLMDIMYLGVANNHLGQIDTLK